MKGKLSAILVASLPAIYIACMGATFLIQSGDEMLLGVMWAYTALALLASLLFCIFTAKAQPKFLAVSNLWFYAGNLALLAAEIIFWVVRFEQNRIAEQNGAMGGGLGLVLLILVYLPHWASYLFTRIAGAISCERTLRGICGVGVKAFHSILQFFPLTDLASAIWVYRKVKSTEYL